MGSPLLALLVPGIRVGDPTWDDAPDAWVEVDGQRTAIELGCAYASPATELWRQPPAAPPNLNFSSSGDDQLAGRRTVDPARIRTLVADLQRLDEKCRGRYGRSFLVLDGSHDQLDEAIPLQTLLEGLHIPPAAASARSTSPDRRFETPRRFVLLSQ